VSITPKADKSAELLELAENCKFLDQNLAREFGATVDGYELRI
jgi:hypothetical protein